MRQRRVRDETGDDVAHDPEVGGGQQLRDAKADVSGPRDDRVTPPAHGEPALEDLEPPRDEPPGNEGVDEREQAWTLDAHGHAWTRIQ